MSDTAWMAIIFAIYALVAACGWFYLRHLYGERRRMHMLYLCAAGVLAVLGAILYWPERMNAGIWVMTSMLTIVSFEDMIAHRVSNKILLIMLAVGILSGLVRGDAPLAMIVAPAVYGLIFIIISLVSKGALGMGDAKLFAVLSIYYGIVDMFTVLFAASIIECLISVVVLIRTKNMRSEIPFVPAIQLGAMVALFWFV